MGANIKNLRTRIKSVDSTLHLTKAMALVASSKVRRANEAMARGRAYSSALRDMIGALAACPDCAQSPYLRSPRDGLPIRIIVIAGDRGLAGGYNSNVFKLAQGYPDAEIIAIGRRACERFGRPPISSEHFTYSDAKELARKLCVDYRDGKCGKIGIIYTKYRNVMTQDAMIEWLLPVEAPDGGDNGGMIFEPDEMSVLTAAIPEYVAGTIYADIRESFACEVAARRMAMDSATDNAQTMKDDLYLAYNRARQSAITQEITEIVAGR